MRYLKRLLPSISLVLLCWSFANAQLVKPRRPTTEAIKPEEKPYKPAPTRAEIENMSVSPIRSISVGSDLRNVTISFDAFPNAVPIVEVGSRKPIVGADGRFAFPTGSWFVARPAGGDKAKGYYRVDMNQELDSGTYYYIITVRKDETPNSKSAQTTGNFAIRKGLYVVRYKGLICDRTTDGPGSDEVYVAMSGVSPSNALEISTTLEPPSGHFGDVTGGRAIVSPGTEVSWGNDATTPAYLSVMLMEQDYGDSDRVRLALETALGQGIAAAAFDVSRTQLTGGQLAQAIYAASITAAASLELDDDVIGVVTRTLNGDELREMARRPKSVERGIQYDFFTEHRGQGGVYRLFFDVIETAN